MNVMEDEIGQPRRRVRVWFGEHVIAEHVGAVAIAERWEQMMRRRFAGLRVTTEDLPTKFTNRQ